MNADTQLLIDMGGRISKRRKEMHMTQEQLAEYADLSLQSISCIELGKKAVRPDNLVKLCEILHLSADYVLFGKRSEEQVQGTLCKLKTLSIEDYRIVEDLVEHLSKKQS